ncbi:saccharopepsin [Ranunculus cassubicifolius]
MSIIFLFLIINGFLFFSVPSLGTNTMRLDLIHRHSETSMNHIERIQDLVHVDNHRVHMISMRRKTFQIAASFPMNSGAYTGTGQYFVRFKIGTPSQKFLLVADTGSDLTWINCARRTFKRHRFYHPSSSSSFKKIPCSSEMCQNLPFSLAEYGSSANGVFANETVTVSLSNGRKLRITDFIVGCSSVLHGSSFISSDGVLGLGYSNNSFSTKVRERFGGKFSYCLVDHLSPKNVSSYLTFGDNKSFISSSSRMHYTELVLNVIEGFYAVNVAGISVNGAMLDIPSETWDVGGEGGVVVDSGTSLTFLAQPAYSVVMKALKSPLKGLVEEIEMKPFEFCFSSVGFGKTFEVPRLVIHFEDLVRFAPPVKSYVIDVADGVKCLGFMPNGWPDLSIIGNIMQQSFLWEFDTVNNRLGFAPTDCGGTH